MVVRRAIDYKAWLMSVSLSGIKTSRSPQQNRWLSNLKTTLTLSTMSQGRLRSAARHKPFESWSDRELAGLIERSIVRALERAIDRSSDRAITRAIKLPIVRAFDRQKVLDITAVCDTMLRCQYTTSYYKVLLMGFQRDHHIARNVLETVPCDGVLRMVRWNIDARHARVG